MNLLFKLLYLSSNFALTPGHLNPASNNPAQILVRNSDDLLYIKFPFFSTEREGEVVIDEFQLIKAISTGQTKGNCFIVIITIIHFKLTKTCNFIEILTETTTLVTLGTTNTFISWFVQSFPLKTNKTG